MGEENNVPVAAEPPKANPLGTPVHPATDKVPPVPRPAAAAGGLRPGLKLPPKPGLAAGLKLPPKAGATVKTMRPGLKLPPKPGLAAGLKLPTRPVIRKPGEAAAAAPAPAASAPKPAAAAPTPVAPMPKPAAVAPTPAAPVVMTPVTPTPKPITATMPKPAAAPVAPKPTASSVDQLKSLTQHLKSVTAPIPVQAILHKTGIIADSAVPDVQKEAAKHKTSRISLSDAMGMTAAPAPSAAPMKTIRIKRPSNIPAGSHPVTPPPAAAPVNAGAPAAPKPPIAPVAAPAAPAAAPSAVNVTQRKTLKVQRPGAGGRPKFTTKKPAAAPAAAAAAPGAVADIPDIPDMPQVAQLPAESPNTVSGVPTGVAVLGVLVQLAACAVMGFLAWQLCQDCQLDLFCGGCALFR